MRTETHYIYTDNGASHYKTYLLEITRSLANSANLETLYVGEYATLARAAFECRRLERESHSEIVSVRIIERRESLRVVTEEG